ncbi:MAG: hypothetical protein IPK23_10230 [Rhizobiales bacterium]|nr:hypothetical protein [Hyphomicrobiales bacterium]
MRGRHGNEWHEHEDDDRPLARPSFAARLIAPANRIFTGKLGRVVRWFAGTLAALVLCLVGVYVAFLTGVLSVDVATPWIVSALEEKLPPGHKVFIGRTRLDYDSTGAPVLTAEKLEIRNDMNEEIVRAPAAEVGLEAGSLLMGNYRARRITLVNAVMTIRLDEHGNIKVSTPKETPQAAVAVQPVAKPKPQQQKPEADHDPLVFSEVANWLAQLERTGIDGIALSEVGLDRGTLIVESDTPGRKWTFKNINFALRRPSAGGVTFRLSSGEAARPWEINASIGAPVNGVRAVDVIADRVVPNDLINAAGYGDRDIFASAPISGILRAEIGVDGKLVNGNFRIIMGKGEVGNARDERGRFEIDEAQVIVRFDPKRGLFFADPLQISGGQNRLVLVGVIEPPKPGTSAWTFGIPQGAIGLTTGRANEPRLTIDNVVFRGAYDVVTQRLSIHEGVLRGPTAGLALSGTIELGGDNPALQLGLVADRMPVSAFKRLWPAPVAPGARTWVLENIESGQVDRAVIALNISLEALATVDPVLPDGAIDLEAQASGVKFTPVAGLPPISEAKAAIHVTGQNVRIRVTNGVMDLGRKRRLTIPEGTFEVPQHYKNPATGIVQMKIEGNGESVADLLSRDLLKGETGVALNPETTRGHIVSNLRIELPLKRELLRSEVRYSAEVDFSGVSADNIVKGQKIEHANGKITISAAQFFVKGEGRIGGAPSVFEYTKPRDKPDAEFRVAATFDDAARSRFGMELSSLTGPITIRAVGYTSDKETRVNVEADLTASTIVELAPGWNKQAGRPARAVYRLVERDNLIKLEELSVTGSGVNLKGSLDLDADGGLISANFTTFALSEGDRATLTVDRHDGAMRITLRGTVLDARGILRSLSETPSAAKKREKPRDIDADVRIGAATGNNGEVIRNLELRVTRRNGEIRSFALLGRVGRDSTLVGELRAREGGRQVLYLTAGDAGAIFRFADYYGKIQGGEIWIVLDTPTMDNAPQEGIVSVRNFTIVGEPNLDRLQSSAPLPTENDRTVQRPQPRGGAVPFVRMRIDFTRTPGRFTIRDALIFGPTIGATVDGVLDYTNNSVQLRGTYVPAYGLNNFFGQIPLVGLFLGGPKEGLLALTFEIAGPASGPTLRVNPMSMAAPGFFRKIFEFRGASDSPGPLSPR